MAEYHMTFTHAQNRRKLFEKQLLPKILLTTGTKSKNKTEIMELVNASQWKSVAVAHRYIGTSDATIERVADMSA